MADIEVTYRGVPVPETLYFIDTESGLAAFLQGIDAALGAEDAEPAKREPRVFNNGDDIPEDVHTVRDAAGWTAKRDGDRWYWHVDQYRVFTQGSDAPTYQPDDIFTSYFPLTEVID